MMRLTTGCHEAFFDVLTGQGLLVLPRVHDDLADPAGMGSEVLVMTPVGPALPTVPPSLHEADQESMVTLLGMHGWEISEDVDGSMLVEGTRLDGRVVVGLYGLAPVIDDAGMGQLAAPWSEILLAAGLR